MNQWTDADPTDEELPTEKIWFVLPLYVDVLGYSCSREWVKDTPDFQCGCPRCLAANGLCLVYDVGDYRDNLVGQAQWRKRIVSARTAAMAKHLIVDGYNPGE